MCLVFLAVFVLFPGQLAAQTSSADEIVDEIPGFELVASASAEDAGLDPELWKWGKFFLAGETEVYVQTFQLDPDPLASEAILAGFLAGLPDGAATHQFELNESHDEVINYLLNFNGQTTTGFVFARGETGYFIYKVGPLSDEEYAEVLSAQVDHAQGAPVPVSATPGASRASETGAESDLDAATGTEDVAYNVGFRAGQIFGALLFLGFVGVLLVWFGKKAGGNDPAKTEEPDTEQVP